MRSIREYIRKTLFDSSSILPAYRLDAPQRVKDFAFVRAPVERLADVLSRGFVLPDKDHVYSLNSQWRVADCSRGVPFAHINEARREFPPAVEAHALHGAYDAFEIYINVAPSDSGMKSYVQLASFWRGNGGAGFDVMPATLPVRLPVPVPGGGRMRSISGSGCRRRRRWHPSISDCRTANGIWSSPICSNIRARSGSSSR